MNAESQCKQAIGTMTDKTTRYECVADAFHCDFQHQLCLGHLGNSLLNASDMHSTQRNFGMTYLNTINKTWVLSRLAIELEDIPKEHDSFTIETWVENAMKYFTKRNWAIYSPDGKKIYGYAKSIWAMIDTVTREPQDILAVNNGRIKEYLCSEKPCAIEDVSRVTTPKMTEYTEFRVSYSDIDVNGHCNSMKYIDHVMDTFCKEHFENYHLKRLEIAYVAEGHWGETIRIYHISPDDTQHFFRLTRQKEEGGEQEVCRLKVFFKSKAV